MLKFIRGKGHQPSAERQKLIKELFAFRKTVQHGFPNKPTALAWDQSLRLLAIGTASGAIKIFGKPGVEFYGQHTNHESAVTQLIFLPNEGRIISLCDDNSLHLWEINAGLLEETKSQALEGKLKKISALCLESAGEHLLLGTEGGNIYLLNVKTFEMSDTIIYQDVVMQNVPEDYKVNPGAVETIAEQPGNSDKILIGYNRGLMVLWNRRLPGAEQTYISNQQLESVCWHCSGQKFSSSHNDGSYAFWDINIGERPIEEPTTLYGPFPCKAVLKFLWRHGRADDYYIFAGGMPRASYSDRSTITILQGKRHTVLDFTSRVIDFLTIPLGSDDKEFDDPDTLIILLEEELIAIDMLSDDWRMMALPYLVSLHASAITCSQHVSNVPDDLWESIVSTGKQQTQNLYSERAWPVTGGVIDENTTEIEKPDANQHKLLLTGHEDGTVRFWDAGGVALRPLYKFGTSHLFSDAEVACDAANGTADEDDEDWPPFRKVGTFDPYSDDPRLAVKKVALCPLSGTLVVAGTAGSIVVAKIGTEQVEKEVQVVAMNIVLDRDGFVWKGHSQLTAHTGSLILNPGFQADSILQLHPPAAVTAVALHSEWGLVVAGTAHGLALFDYIRHKGVLSKCTLNPHDMSGAGEAPISRRKSFKKSLRESFRRLRKGRSSRNPDKRGAQSPSTAAPASEKKGTGDSSTPSSGALSPVEPKPVERQVEARPVDDSMGSMVRCVYLCKTFIISVQNQTPTMWAGTNNGTVYIFTISVPPGQSRTSEDVSGQLAKEIQLKHRAPVVTINVLDGINAPLPEPFAVEKGLSKIPDTSGPHRVLISSEEQFKVFNLPNLKPFGKFKLTAHEGTRVRRTGIAQFTTMRPSVITQYTEFCLLCLTNLGDCIVLSLPDLRRQLDAAIIRREDINGISSLTFTHWGEAFYLHSSSEIQRVTLSATCVLQPRCHVNLPEGAREIPPREEQPTENVEDEEEGRIEGREVSAPSPTAQEQQSAPPIVNGDIDSESREGREPKIEEPRENGLDEERETSTLSVGDITIDSVKDHLISTDENRTSEIKSVEVTSRTTETQSVVVKTTVISSSEMTVVNSGDIAVESLPPADGPPPTTTTTTITTITTRTHNEVNSGKAPLAKMEDFESGMITET